MKKIELIGSQGHKKRRKEESKQKIFHQIFISPLNFPLKTLLNSHTKLVKVDNEYVK